MPQPRAFRVFEIFVYLLKMFRASNGEQLGTVSCMQLLITNLVERVHDAVWVLPRHAAQEHEKSLEQDHTNIQPLNLDEYAIDIAYSLRALQKEALNLPSKRSYETTKQRLDELVEEERAITEQLKTRIDEASQIRSKLNLKINSSF